MIYLLGNDEGTFSYEPKVLTDEETNLDFSIKTSDIASKWVLNILKLDPKTGILSQRQPRAGKLRSRKAKGNVDIKVYLSVSARFGKICE